MKGESKITVKGKEYGVRFTLGAMEELQDHLDAEGFEGGTEKALQKMKYLRVLLSKMTKFAGNELPAEDFKEMDFSEVESAISLIGKSTNGARGGKGLKGK